MRSVGVRNPTRSEFVAHVTIAGLSGGRVAATHPFFPTPMMELVQNFGPEPPRSFLSALLYGVRYIRLFSHSRRLGNGGDAALFDMWWLLIVPIDDTNAA